MNCAGIPLIWVCFTTKGVIQRSRVSHHTPPKGAVSKGKTILRSFVRSYMDSKGETVIQFPPDSI